MDGKGFFLGLIAAVVLFLLWKKESGPNMSFTFPGIGNSPAQPSDGMAGCLGCGAVAGVGSPSYASAPAVQSQLAIADGQITPGTPPLQSVTGTGSFYAGTGPTPDNSFTNFPRPTPVSVVASAAPQVSAHAPNVVSSPTTPATNVPARAVGIVPPYSAQGFQQRYNVAGIPRTAMIRPATRMIQ